MLNFRHVRGCIELSGASQVLKVKHRMKCFVWLAFQSPWEPLCLEAALSSVRCEAAIIAERGDLQLFPKSLKMALFSVTDFNIMHAFFTWYLMTLRCQRCKQYRNGPWDRGTKTDKTRKMIQRRPHVSDFTRACSFLHHLHRAPCVLFPLAEAIASCRPDPSILY